MAAHKPNLEWAGCYNDADHTSAGDGKTRTYIIFKRQPGRRDGFGFDECAMSEDELIAAIIGLTQCLDFRRQASKMGIQ